MFPSPQWTCPEKWDLVLLVTDDASGRLSVPAAQLDAGLGGANLLELTLMHKVDLSGEEDEGKPGDPRRA